MRDNFGLDEVSVEELFHSLSNWGRWGDGDEKGTLNLLTPQKVLQARDLIQDGVTVSMSRLIENVPAIDVADPPLMHMTYSGEEWALNPDHRSHPWGVQLARDFLGFTYHGLYLTHLDALSHFFYKGMMYNNASPAAVRTDGGATLCSVDDAAAGIISRGILADVARHRGVPWLEPGEAIGPKELESVLDAEGVTPEPGDVLVVRTGHWERRTQLGPAPVSDGFPGLHGACVPLLKNWDIAMLAGDSINDVVPSGFEVMAQPIHEIGQVSLGLWLLDNCELGALGEACHERSRYEFFFSLLPLRVKGGTGSPANPIAIF
jgi:kynurenine formamidase